MRYTLIFVFVFSICIGSVRAEPVNTTYTEAELVTENTSVQPGKSFWVALRLKPRKGWHTYWRYPGDSGLQPKITWQLPPGYRAGPFHWPAPKKIKLGPLVNYGYHDEVLLLTKMTAPRRHTTPKQITIRAKATWLVCEKICVPEEADLRVSLPIKKNKPRHHRWHRAFKQTRLSTPQPFPWTATFIVQDQTITLSLVVSASNFKTIKDVQFFPNRYGMIKNAAPQRWAATPSGHTLMLTRGPLITNKTVKFSGVIVLTGPTGAGKQRRAYDLTALRHEKAL